MKHAVLCMAIGILFLAGGCRLDADPSDDPPQSLSGGDYPSYQPGDTTGQPPEGTTPVPEPLSAALVGLGMVGLGVWHGRQKRS